MPSLAVVQKNRLTPFFETELSGVREELLENSYIEEAYAALEHKLYRSAVLNMWSGTIDDLRNKVLYRSVEMFSKAVKVGREIKSYEDIQDHVTDDALIEGAHQIGILDWEARKLLKQAKDTRNIFSAHPRSTRPSHFKTAAMFEDCIKYVLGVPYPEPIIDIDDYLALMETADFDRTDIAVRGAVTGLPAIYSTQLINRIFTKYIDDTSGSNLRSNIEFVAPLLWRALTKDAKKQVANRVDKVMKDGNAVKTKKAFKFFRVVRANVLLSVNARLYIVKPLVDRLREKLCEWKVEDQCVLNLKPYAACIPPALVAPYVSAITHTFIGHMGYSAMWGRRDFYANVAAVHIPGMMKLFDDEACAAFVECIKKSKILRDRVRTPEKMNRLRTLAKVVRDRASEDLPHKRFLNALLNPKRLKEFRDVIR